MSITFAFSGNVESIKYSISSIAILCHFYFGLFKLAVASLFVNHYFMFLTLMWLRVLLSFFYYRRCGVSYVLAIMRHLNKENI